MDIIFIKNLTMKAIIGILPNERIEEQPISISVDIYLNTQRASKSGLLTDTIDYALIAKKLISLIKKQKYYLIEKAAEDCASMILDYSLVQKVCIRLSKPTAIESAENAGICIIRP